MAYQPIENYGIIGNMRTAALVRMNESIDWFCYPNFDSPSVFGAIPDEQRGGRFEIAPAMAGLRLNSSSGRKRMSWLLDFSHPKASVKSPPSCRWVAGGRPRTPLADPTGARCARNHGLPSELRIHN